MLKFFKFSLSILFILFPSSIFAEVQKENSSFFISSSSTIQYLATYYSSKFQVGNRAGIGSSSDQSKYHVTEPISLGYHLGKEVNLRNDFDLELAIIGAISNGEIFYPDGSGVFVEKITASSTAFEISPKVSFFKMFINDRYIFKIGGGYTFFWSEEKFNFGDWVIYEHQNKILPSFHMSLSSKFKNLNKMGYYFGVKTMSEEAYFDLGVHFSLGS